jgi:two-component system response regulator AtoC
MPSPSSDDPAEILIVEDDEGLRSLLAEDGEDAGAQVTTAASAEEAVAQLREVVPDLVVSDLRLPGMSGMDLLCETRSMPVPPAFIVITAFGSISQAVEALKAGADDFLPKPLDLDHFMITVERSLETRRLRREVQRMREWVGTDHFHGMIGASRPMRTLFDQIRQVAGAQGPVLIVGESGVGKELVAQALHAEGPRANQPFRAVNCAGVPGELLESEFFGHEKGAFTGAQASREGLFRAADGGTLLLDEVTEMPMALQAKLLRVLQEGTVRPVGSAREEPVDVRVLASTNRDLAAEIEEGRFREDLFYRLETFTLSVPPLRERGDDLDRLAAHFLKRYAAQADAAAETLAPDTIEHLRSYPFPGNVRELENAIERAVTFSTGEAIEIADLPARIREHNEPAPESGTTAGLSPLLSGPDGLPTLDEIERRYIDYVLTRVDGNKRRAAQLLDIGRRTLYRKLDS